MSHYSEQFLKQNPLAVLGVLRDLQKGEVPLRISWSNNQFISKILDASQDRLVIDLGSQEYENRAALKAENIAVMAETQGAKVEFVLSRLELAEQVWDINFNSNTNVVEVAIRRLRGKVDEPFDKKLLHTVRGMGYVLEPRSD